MRVPRFYIDQALQPDTTLTMPDALAHYMFNVLRLTEDQPIVLFNGDGSDYAAQISTIEKRNVEVQINTKLQLNVESTLHIHLGQAVSKGDRMEVALQKSVELGVTEITPIITENCNVKLDQQRWQKKHQAWQKLIISACEQCQRNVIPTLHEAISFQQWLGQSSELNKIILAPNEKTYLSNVPRPQRGFRLLIGPEGGFSQQEVYTATQTGYQACNLGSRILRTETAAIASISILQAIHGDL